MHFKTLQKNFHPPLNSPVFPNLPPGTCPHLLLLHQPPLPRLHQYHLYHRHILQPSEPPLHPRLPRVRRYQGLLPLPRILRPHPAFRPEDPPRKPPQSDKLLPNQRSFPRQPADPADPLPLLRNPAAPRQPVPPGRNPKSFPRHPGAVSRSPRRIHLPQRRRCPKLPENAHLRGHLL